MSLKDDKDLFLFSLLGSFLIIFLLVPVIICLVLGTPKILSLRNDYEAFKSIYLSFYAGFTTTIIVTLFGTPLAYLLSRYKSSNLTKATESLVEVPLALPHSVAGIMILLAYGSRAPLGQLLSNLGIIIEDNYWGIVFAMMFVSSPIFITTAKAGFDSIDPELENVAKTLGATSLKCFLTITLPLAFRHLIAGSILTLARAISEVGAIIIVAYYPKVASTLVIERFLEYGLSSALTLSALLAIISIIIFFLLILLTKGLEKL